MQDIPEFREGTPDVRAVLGWQCVCLFVCVVASEVSTYIDCGEIGR